MTNPIFYKRITGSSIQGDAYSVTEPNGTLVIANGGELRLHDGSVAGGNPVGGGGSTLVNGSKTVSLDSGGNLTFADAGGTFFGNGYLQSGTKDTNIGIKSWNSRQKVFVNETNVTVQTVDNLGQAYDWTFGTDGGLTLPLGGYITAPSAMGSNTVIQAPVSNRALLQNSDGTNLVAADDQGVAMTTVRGTVQFGYNLEAPGVPTHFHINKLNQSFDLFFGDDSNYFHLPAGGGSPVIGANDGSSGQKLWTFGQDGNLTLPQSNSGAAVISAGAVGLEFTSNGHAFQFNTDGTLIFPDNTVQTTAYRVMSLPPLTAWGTVVSFDNLSFSFDATTGSPGFNGGYGQGSGSYSTLIWTADLYQQQLVSTPNSTISSGGPVQYFNYNGPNLITEVALTPGDSFVLRIQDVDTNRVYRATFLASFKAADTGNEGKYGAITVERLS